MAKTDLDVIKEIPGYKVILKAVVKSQIQQLVEQLAAHTDEESVILTASVSDGTLSHIGSASGKSFLQDHEDFKSQFLGFCLKDQHRRKMEKERLEREKIEQELLQQQQQQQQQQMMYLPPGPRFTKSPSQYAARYQSPRHQPYSVPRPRRPHGVAQMSMSKVEETVVKAERVDSDDASNQSGMDNQGLKTSSNLSDSGADNDCQGAESDTSNIVGNDSLNAEQGGSNERHNSEDIVKLEPLTESELDLEITRVEPGQSTQEGEESKWDPNSSQGGEDWDPSVSMEMGYNLGGATGSAEDMTGQQGYTLFSLHDPTKPECPICHKSYSSKYKLKRHMIIHTGELPFECEICGHRFNRKDTLKTHNVLVHVKAAEMLNDL
ncbi:zinc finger and BTB domain-containing protein 20-like isoform X5 [Dreissena polymorpha]|uniref:zinc finger and BTB domain-containing protein 20-like isoform X5 n=1 Tax=Dreissena polymorpha TaxID=45954 RepID=UPI002264EC93|nr:zinc finger and BTB domain-containing protein 20-like isoform X5 [Dreissena polymorpha]